MRVKVLMGKSDMNTIINYMCRNFFLFVFTVVLLLNVLCVILLMCVIARKIKLPILAVTNYYNENGNKHKRDLNIYLFIY